MFFSKYKNVFSSTAALSADLLLAGCGGASDSGTEQTSILESPHENEPAQTVSVAAASAALSDPAPQASSATPAPPAPIAAVTEKPPRFDAPAAATPAPAPALPLATTETITLATSFTPLVQGTINATPYWPVWYGTGKPVDGVNCLVSGKVHLHSLISIYKDGKRLGFPDGIGRVHGGCYHAYELHVHGMMATPLILSEGHVVKF